MELTREVEQAATALEIAAQNAKDARDAVVDALQVDALVDDLKEMDISTDDVNRDHARGVITAEVIWKHFEKVTARVADGTEIPGQRKSVACDLFFRVKAMVEADKAHTVASERFIAALGRSVAK